MDHIYPDIIKSDLLPGVHCHHHIQPTMERRHVHCELLVPLQRQPWVKFKFRHASLLDEAKSEKKKCHLVFQLLPAAAPGTRVHHLLPQRVLHLVEQ